MRIERTVFISYRRTNVWNALAIYQNLTHRGYDAFFDYLSVGPGDFSQVILSHIASRAHFLVLLTPSALERCEDPEDWLRREIEHAIACKRNVVPLTFDGFDFAEISRYLPPHLAEPLKHSNALAIPAAFFDEAMNRLDRYYLSKPLESILLPPTPEAVEEERRQKNAMRGQAPVTARKLTAEQYFEQGMAKRKRGDLVGAIACYDEAIRLNPQFAAAYNNRGVARRDLRRRDDAIDDFTRAIELDPDDSVAYNNRGIIYKEYGALRAAISDYSEAIRLNAKFATAYYNRGLAYRESGDLDRAIRDYTRAIRLNPDDATIFNNRGVARQEQGDVNGAIADFTEAVRVNPKYDRAYNNRGVMRQSRGDLAGAIADFSEAIWLNPDQKRAPLGRAGRHGEGSLHADLDDEEADTVPISPTLAAAYNNRGEVYFENGEFARASQDFQRTNALQPGNWSGRAGLAITLYALGATDAALNLWRELAADSDYFRDAAWVQTALGWRPALVDAARGLIALL